MIAVSVLLMLIPTAPQGVGEIRKLLEAEKVVDRLPKRQRVGRPGVAVRPIIEAGVDAPRLVRSLVAPRQPTPPGAIELINQGIELAGYKRNRIPKDVRARSIKDIEVFFTRAHREVRKALGVDLNFGRTVPELHGLLAKVRADPAMVWTADDRKVIQRERKSAAKVDLRAMHGIALRIMVMAELIAKQRSVLVRQATRRSRDGVTGTVLVDKDVGFGRLVIGGVGRNVYNCDQIALIVDLGGDDEYHGAIGGTNAQRRLAVCIDVDGNDVYRGGSGALGSATYGLGVCIDLAGTDDYRAGPRSAGFGAAGIGLFVDVAGDDKLVVGGHSGGVGLFGLGQCFDLAGDDKQRGDSGCFGVGLTGGVGQFVDVRGGDQRHLVGSEGRAFLGFGAGRGLRADLPGGLGVCVDHGGDDSYTGGDFALGFGDHGGVGICVDFAGDDSYITGGMSLGASRGHGVGIMLEIAGKDHYFGSEGLAVAGTNGTAFFEDHGGDDIYEVSGAGMGRAATGGMAFFQDLGGRNSFRFRVAKPVHLPPDPGGFALFRSLGVGDTYLPRTRDPGAKGRRLETNTSFQLHLAR